MFFNNLEKYNRIILGTASPRRHKLFKELGLDFEILVKNDVEEIYPDGLSNTEIAIYLADLKSKKFTEEIADNCLVITADTIVILGDKIIGKPTDIDDAWRILTELSGNKHRVTTGVSIISCDKKISFHADTDVYFKELSSDEIDYYLSKYKPLDKAGSYGIQEWIGYIGIEKIDGSYFNVMGLPVQRLYEELKKW